MKVVVVPFDFFSMSTKILEVRQKINGEHIKSVFPLRLIFIFYQVNQVFDRFSLAKINVFKV